VLFSEDFREMLLSPKKGRRLFIHSSIHELTFTFQVCLHESPLRTHAASTVRDDAAEEPHERDPHSRGLGLQDPRQGREV